MIIGIDQYGVVYHNLGKHPRKALLQALSRSHAAKMYRDKKSGPPVHTGYVIAGRWIELFKREERPV